MFMVGKSLYTVSDYIPTREMSSDTLEASV